MLTAVAPVVIGCLMDVRPASKLRIAMVVVSLEPVLYITVNKMGKCGSFLLLEVIFINCIIQYRSVEHDFYCFLIEPSLEQMSFLLFYSFVSWII